MGWIKRFILFHRKPHPEKLGGKEIESVVLNLAVAEEVSASTQNQAGRSRCAQFASQSVRREGEEGSAPSSDLRVFGGNMLRASLG